MVQLSNDVPGLFAKPSCLFIVCHCHFIIVIIILIIIISIVITTITIVIRMVP